MGGDSWILWQAVSDFIVVPFLCNEDVEFGARICGTVKGTHGESNPILLRPIKEHGASTPRAKPAANPWGRVIPGDGFGPRDLDSAPRYIRADVIVPRELSALDAVTSVGGFQVT